MNKDQSALHDRLAVVFLRRLGRHFFSACLQLSTFYLAAKPYFLFWRRLVAIIMQLRGVVWELNPGYWRQR